MWLYLPLELADTNLVPLRASCLHAWRLSQMSAQAGACLLRMRPTELASAQLPWLSCLQLAVGLPPPEFAAADTSQLHTPTLANIAAKRGLPPPGSAAAGPAASAQQV